MAIKQFPDIEKRVTDRVNVHLLEQRIATIRANSCVLKTRVIDFSPFGIGVVLDGPASRAVIVQGESVNISVIRNGQEIVFDAVLVTKGKMTIMEETYTRLGFRIASHSVRRHIGNARKNKRFMLGEVVELSCYCIDPINEGQKAFFVVDDLSATGLQLSTSARNKFLLPQMRLQMEIVVPGEGSFPEELIVRHIRPTEEGDRYILGCEFVKPQRRTLEALADFCLSFGKDSSYQALLEEGFPLAFDSASLAVQITESPQDFMQIVAIRLKDAHWRGQLLKVRDPGLTSDDQDEYARHVCVKVGSRVVAAGRIVFNNGERGRCSLESRYQVPGFLWQFGFVEVSKVAVDPEFRGSMAFVKLWNEIFRIAFLSGVNYMAFAFSREWPAVMQNFGLLRTGLRDADPASGEELVGIDMKAALKGTEATFASWSIFAAPLIEKLVAEGQIPQGFFLGIKLKLARLTRALNERRMIWEAKFKKNQSLLGPKAEMQSRTPKNSRQHVA